MKKKLLLIQAFLIATILGSCKKDKDLSREEYLTQNQWKVVEMTVDPGFPIYEQDSIVGYQTDLWKDTPECTRDNYYDFKSDGTVISDEGPTKCNESDPQRIEGSWSFNDEKTILTYISPDGKAEYRYIEKLDSEDFIISMNDTVEENIHLITVSCKPRE